MVTFNLKEVMKHIKHCSLQECRKRGFTWDSIFVCILSSSRQRQNSSLPTMRFIQPPRPQSYVLQLCEHDIPSKFRCPSLSASWNPTYTSNKISKTCFEMKVLKYSFFKLYFNILSYILKLYILKLLYWIEFNIWYKAYGLCALELFQLQE